MDKHIAIILVNLFNSNLHSTKPTSGELKTKKGSSNLFCTPFALIRNENSIYPETSE